MSVTTDQTNPRGIPQAAFIEDVAQFTKGDPKTTSHELNEIYGKYKYLEYSVNQNRHLLRNKIPDIQRSLDMVTYLKQKGESTEHVSTHFELTDTIYAQAKVIPNDRVCLWLGADVMVEYTYDEAITLLTKNLTTTKASLESFEEDAIYLRDQITTTEVNIARVHNYDVKLRQSTAVK